MTEDIILYTAGLLTGMMRSGFGGGVGAVAAPLMVLVMPVKMALGVFLPLTLTADVISAQYYWGRWEPSLVRTLLPGCLLGVVLGSVLLDLIPETVFRKILGGMACLFATLQMVGSHVTDRLQTTSWVGGLAVGVATGLTSTLLSSGGVIMMLYLAPFGLTGRMFVGTVFLVGVVLSVAKIVPYATLGLIDEKSLGISLTMLPALVLGAVVGIVLNRRLPRDWFDRMIKAIALIVGTKLLVS